nr:hypothetical protein [Paracoccus sediminilitoris]
MIRLMIWYTIAQCRTMVIWQLRPAPALTRISKSKVRISSLGLRSCLS